MIVATQKGTQSRTQRCTKRPKGASDSPLSCRLRKLWARTNQESTKKVSTAITALNIPGHCGSTPLTEQKWARTTSNEAMPRRPSKASNRNLFPAEWNNLDIEIRKLEIDGNIDHVLYLMRGQSLGLIVTLQWILSILKGRQNYTCKHVVEILFIRWTNQGHQNMNHNTLPQWFRLNRSIGST